jgi:hypothetical protein
MNDSEDLEAIKDLNNQYVIKQVLEMYLKKQLSGGISDQEMFGLIIDTLILINGGASVGLVEGFN